MYRALIAAGILFSVGAAAQSPTSPPTPVEISLSPLQSINPAPPSVKPAPELPDAPSAVQEQQEDVVAVNRTVFIGEGKVRKPCNVWDSLGWIVVDPEKFREQPPPCSELIYPYQNFLGTNVIIPLSWQGKGYLALHYTTDPASIGTIVGISAISIAADSHTAYGPGLEGFGKLAGVSVLQNATAEFFGTFAVPVLTHQDPRYFRMPGRPFGKRILYAVSRSYISRSDEGKRIPNYGVLSAYPLVAELSNLYVPGIESDGASTAKRILTGYALDPVNNIVNEFLPDVAKRIHVRIIFVQQILNNVAASQGGLP